MLLNILFDGVGSGGERMGSPEQLPPVANPLLSEPLPVVTFPWRA